MHLLNWPIWCEFSEIIVGDASSLFFLQGYELIKKDNILLFNFIKIVIDLAR